MATSQTERFGLTIEDDDEFCSILKTAENFGKLDEKAENIDNKVTQEKDTYSDDEYMSARLTKEVIDSEFKKKSRSTTLLFTETNSQLKTVTLKDFLEEERLLKIHIFDRDKVTYPSGEEIAGYAELIYNLKSDTYKTIYISPDLNLPIEFHRWREDMLAITLGPTQFEPRRIDIIAESLSM